jgi:hypothetical protein
MHRSEQKRMRSCSKKMRRKRSFGRPKQRSHGEKINSSVAVGFLEICGVHD